MKNRIVITGAGGLIGSALIPQLSSEGYECVQLKRPASRHVPASTKAFEWDIDRGTVASEAFERCTAVIHLAGANIADHPWTRSYKQEILNSRTRSTELLVENIIKLSDPPKVFIGASAIGYYGNHSPNVTLDEHSPSGNDFLSDVCRRWETAAAPLTAKGIRVVHSRFGVVLSENGGALAKMLPIFRLGLGGRLGSGQQIMSWVALDEIPHIMSFILSNTGMSGAVNCVSPNPVSNADFTRTVGKVLRRPTVLPAPAFALKLALGEMADALLLNGARIVPHKLLNAGYRFHFPDLTSTLLNCL